MCFKYKLCNSNKYMYICILKLRRLKAVKHIILGNCKLQNSCCWCALELPHIGNTNWELQYMSFSIEKVIEYDQEIPQSHIADQPMAYILKDFKNASPA